MLFKDLDLLNLKVPIFIFGLVVFTFFGLLFPYRNYHSAKILRWVSNISLSLIGSLVVYFLSLIFLNDVFELPFGVFKIIGLPFFYNLLFGFIILDLVIYFQHILFHKIPILWKIHRAHHSDTDFDASTALRFHPLEALISFFTRLFIVLIFGISPLVLVFFEVVLNFSAMFNHSNFSLPVKLEAVLRIFIITPDVHRVHHSMIVDETNSNYGFFISLWDRVFSTYKSKSRNDLKQDFIGIEYFRGSSENRLDQLLTQPFRNKK